MSEVNTFKYKNKNLTAILQNSDNRFSFVELENYKYDGTNVKFAKFNSNVHVFNEDTGIDEYFKRNGINNNLYDSGKGVLPNGFSPLINEQECFKDYGLYFIYYKTNSTKDPGNFGNMYINKAGRGDIWGTRDKPKQVPNIIVLGVQAGGGCGKKGNTSIFNQKGGHGGGSGAFIPVAIELPFKTAESWTKICTIGIGEGGIDTDNEDEYVNEDYTDWYDSHRRHRDGHRSILYDSNERPLIIIPGGISGYKNYINEFNFNLSEGFVSSKYTEYFETENSIFTDSKSKAKFSVLPNARVTHYPNYNTRAFYGLPGVPGSSAKQQGLKGNLYLKVDDTLSTKLYLHSCGDNSTLSDKYGGAGAGSACAKGAEAAANTIGNNGTLGSGGSGGGFYLSGNNPGGNGGDGCLIIYW